MVVTTFLSQGVGGVGMRQRNAVSVTVASRTLLTSYPRARDSRGLLLRVVRGSEVPEAGLEPARPLGQWILNPSCLPIPSLRPHREVSQGVHRHNRVLLRAHLAFVRLREALRLRRNARCEVNRPGVTCDRWAESRSVCSRSQIS